MKSEETSSEKPLILKDCFRVLCPRDTHQLIDFCKSLVLRNEDLFFHPHLFDVQTLTQICSNPGRDYFCGMFRGTRLVAYGMLRGWNEGFENPSLGLAIHPLNRGQGWAPRMLEHLHAYALSREVRMIRLTVYRKNSRAMQLFEKAGYRFPVDEKPKVVGWFEFKKGDSTK